MHRARCCSRCNGIRTGANHHYTPPSRGASNNTTLRSVHSVHTTHTQLRRRADLLPAILLLTESLLGRFSSAARKPSGSVILPATQHALKKNYALSSPQFFQHLVRRFATGITTTEWATTANHRPPPPGHDATLAAAAGPRGDLICNDDDGGRSVCSKTRFVGAAAAAGAVVAATVGSGCCRDGTLESDQEMVLLLMMSIVTSHVNWILTF